MCRRSYSRLKWPWCHDHYSEYLHLKGLTYSSPFSKGCYITHLLPEWEGKVWYKQNNGFLLAENVQKKFIFSSIARSNVIAMAFESFFKTIVLKKTLHSINVTMYIVTRVRFSFFAFTENNSSEFLNDFERIHIERIFRAHLYWANLSQSILSEFESSE